MRHPEFLHSYDKFVAGNIANRAEAWLEITSDPWIAQTVAGLEIDLVGHCYQPFTPYPYKIAPDEVGAINQQMERFLQKGIVVPTVREENDFISNIFSKPKSDGSVRIILDLSQLNDEIEKLHFKMNSLQTALDMIRQGCFMASVDLRDAYYSVKIHPRCQKLLKFFWQGQLYQFVGMPNGLTSAPRTFTKLMTPVFAHLRTLGHECFGYIDDTFLLADTFEQAQTACNTLAHTLDKLGFVIHEKKSVLTPTQNLVFLGFELDSNAMAVKITPGKIEKFLRAVTALKQKKKSTIRAVAGLIGLMISYLPCLTYGGAYIKTLEIEKNFMLRKHKGNFDAKMSISPAAWEDIEWWVVNLPNAARPIRVINPQITIYTDASLQGWGAYTDYSLANPNTTGGRWRNDEAEFHINVLELKAIHHGLRALIHTDFKQVKVMTDNTTALAYIKNMGGVQSQQCNREAKEIWKYCEQHGMWLIPAHIPGKLNVEADLASRKFSDDIEWELAPKLWHRIIANWGQPTIDMFASRINY